MPLHFVTAMGPLSLWVGLTMDQVDSLRQQGVVRVNKRFGLRESCGDAIVRATWDRADALKDISAVQMHFTPAGVQHFTIKNQLTNSGDGWWRFYADIYELVCDEASGNVLYQLGSEYTHIL